MVDSDRPVWGGPLADCREIVMDAYGCLPCNDSNVHLQTAYCTGIG